MKQKESPESVVRQIRRKTRKQHKAEEKIKIVLEGLRGEESIAAICRREGINPNLYYKWSKDFLEAGKKRLLFLAENIRKDIGDQSKNMKGMNRRVPGRV